MLTDYKFSVISRNGSTTCKVGFYEGEITTEMETRGWEAPALITRYRRNKFLGVKEFAFDGNKTDKELRTLMNIELAKDTLRSPIIEQKVEQKNAI